jgi:hypothetical protein
MPLQRIFCLHGVIEKDHDGVHKDWETLLKAAEQDFGVLTKSAPWRATHTSGGGAGDGSTGVVAKAAKGTLGAFFKVQASSSCVICNRPGGTNGVCARDECSRQAPVVRSELESIIRESQTAQRICVAEWQHCLGGIDPKRWSMSGASTRPPSASSSGAALSACERPKLLVGCENEYVDVPFRMMMAVQAESRASQRLHRLGSGGL